jgi:DNA polymerase-3 subunit alpha
VFELMAHFADYGFNKSHSAAYALVAYQTAWLKAHHPLHFLAALLTTEKANTDKLVQYIAECRRMGVQVLPPDVNGSQIDFAVEGEGIRFGLSAIKNAGEAAIQSILDGRARVGRYRSLGQLCEAIDPRLVNKRVLEALVQSGALDSFGPRRSQLAALLDVALERAQKARSDREAGQGSLFGAADPATDDPVAPDLPDWDERTRLTYEKATLGFYVSGHPLDAYREPLRALASHSVAELGSAAPGSDVAVGGIIANLRRRRSKKGEWWASLAIEDLEGTIEVLVFPKAYASFQALLEDARPILAQGRLDVEEERRRIVVESICLLDEVRERRADAVQIRLDARRLDAEVVARLREAVEAHRGEARLFLEVEAGTFRVVALAEAFYRVRPCEGLERSIESIVGPDRVRYRRKPADRALPGPPGR